MSSKPVLKLDWCSHQAAKYAVEHWHYSRSLPMPPLAKIGVWEDERFIGCVLFGRGSVQNLGRPFGLPQTEICELVRVALAAHRSAVSRIVAIALRQLKTANPSLRLVVSFADPTQGHVGGIYQAGNWLYLGERAPTTEFIGPDGKQWHGRMVSPTGLKKVYGEYRPVWKPEQCQKVIVPGKHKYAMPLDDAMHQQIATLAKPYPKRPRAGSLDSEASVSHTDQGGATPTPALHEGVD